MDEKELNIAFILNKCSTFNKFYLLLIVWNTTFWAQCPPLDYRAPSCLATNAVFGAGITQSTATHVAHNNKNSKKTHTRAITQSRTARGACGAANTRRTHTRRCYLIDWLMGSSSFHVNKGHTHTHLFHGAKGLPCHPCLPACPASHSSGRKRR